MAADGRSRTFAFVDERAAPPGDWSELDEILGAHADRLSAALGGDWQVEGPLYEADTLRIDLGQRLRLDAEQRTATWLQLSLSYPIEGALAETPPARLRFVVDVHQDELGTHPRPASKDLGAMVVTGLVMGGAAGVGYAIYRWSHSPVWAFLVGAIALVPILVVALVVDNRLRRLLGPPPPPPPPLLPEVTAAQATVERCLRAWFAEVTTEA